MIPESSLFHTFIEPARVRGAWWRVLTGLLLVCAIWFGFGLVLVGLISSGYLLPLGIDGGAVAGIAVDGRAMPPKGVMFFLLTFLGLWLGLWVAVRLVHRRAFGTLFSASGRPDTRNLWNGMALGLGFYVVSIIAYCAVIGPPVRTDLSLSVWGIWLLPIILAIAMQASSEELLFRGYILQQFANWSRHPLIWAVIPALIFTALHYDANMEAGMRWRMLVHILIFGLVMAALVWRTGGLGASMGLHIANNILAICGFGITGNALGFELWVFLPGTMERMFLFDLGTGLLMLAGVLILFRPGPQEQKR